METQPQDTHPQDPIERFALHIEGLRRMPVPRGIARIVHWLLLEFFTYVLRVAAHFAEQRRNGTLPEVAPAAAREPRAWPADLRPRESGWVEQRGDQLALGGGNRSGHSGAGGDPGCPMVGAVAGMDSRLRGNDGIEPAAQAPRHVNHGDWPQSRGPGMVWTTGAGLLRLDSKKWILAMGDSCVHFVTIT